MDKQEPQVKHEENSEGGRFFIEAGVEMTYRRGEGNSIIVNHTAVADSHRGQGLGGVLYRAMIDYAVSQQLRVVPRCDYVVAMLKRHPEDAARVTG